MLGTPVLHQGDTFGNRTAAIIAVSSWAIGHHIQLQRIDSDASHVSWTCACQPADDREAAAHVPLQVTTSRNANGSWDLTLFNPGDHHERSETPKAEEEHIRVATWRNLQLTGVALHTAVEQAVGTKVSLGKIRYAVALSYQKTGVSAENQWKLLPALIRKLEETGITASYQTTGTIAPLQIIRWFLASPYAAEWCRSPSFVGVVFVDGCHLKDEARGTLLVMCTVTPNHDILPLAFQWCQGETKENYTAFLTACHEWLPGETTFMSDESEAFLGALEAVFPDAPHGLCAFHIAKKLGPARKEFWRLILSETKKVFEARWASFQEHHPELAGRIAPKLEKVVIWLGAPFRFGYNADSPVESINASLLNVRSDDPCLLLTGILEFCQTRLDAIKAVIEAQQAHMQYVPWCNNVVARRTRPLDTSDVLIGQRNNYHVMEINDVGVTVPFHVTHKSCDCCSVDREGIPCRHMWLLLDRDNQTARWYEMISPVYRMDAMRAALEQCSKAFEIPDVGLLEADEGVTIPSHKRQSGRPPENRHRAPDEGAAPAKRKVQCSKCSAFGHNARSCRR